MPLGIMFYQSLCLVGELNWHPVRNRVLSLVMMTKENDNGLLSI